MRRFWGASEAVFGPQSPGSGWSRARKYSIFNHAWPGATHAHENRLGVAVLGAVA